MAYDTILERQRAAFLAALPLTPENASHTHQQLMYDYLGSLGYLQPHLLERLQAWAIAENVPYTLAYTTIGLV